MSKLPFQERVHELLGRMTLKEKIGQMNLMFSRMLSEEEIAEGVVGGVFLVNDAKYARHLQSLAMRSRLRIPLIIGEDVIHGFRTTFPVPLAEAASWDLQAVERSARIAALEASASGISWVFAPMVDVARDPRWGRVVEGSGEDPFLGSQMAAARVRGFQGEGLGSPTSVLACAKHFVAYGACESGLDGNTADISKRTLEEVHLPPFEAAVRAGVGSVMSAYNDIGGVPLTANEELVRKRLKEQMNFSGLVVSDFWTVKDLELYGVAANGAEASQLAIRAGIDMDMTSVSYLSNLESLVESGAVDLALVNEAVARILTKKFELGLFEDAFSRCDEARERSYRDCIEHRAEARDMARRSIVLLQNREAILPLNPTRSRVALIGPLANAHSDLLGPWRIGFGRTPPLFARVVMELSERLHDPDVSIQHLLRTEEQSSSLEGHPPVVSLLDGLRAVFGENLVDWALGCEVLTDSKATFDSALEAARHADVLVVAVGETYYMSGELSSRASLKLPGVQTELIKELSRLGKPIVLVVMAGRPLVLTDLLDKVHAVLYVWWLGTEAGNAIADVLVGSYNPSGRLPITFPRSEGQIPIYYNRRLVGRQRVLFYQDIPDAPLFHFGFGLSYTNFTYSQLSLSSDSISVNDSLIVRLLVRNSGSIRGEEVVQLYSRPLVSSTSRPIIQLRAFTKVEIAAGATAEVTFTIPTASLAHYDAGGKWSVARGERELLVGASSSDIRLRERFTIHAS